MESLALVRNFLVAAGVELSIPPRDLYHLQLAAEEACTNIIEHGAPARFDAGAPIDLDLESSRVGWTLTIRDRGRPFDPTSLPPPDISCGIGKRKPGGLGVFLMRRLVDELHYSSSAGENRLKLTVRRSLE